MAIVAADLKFIASERMIDNLSTVAGVGGGGYMSEAEVIDAVENNVFPDVMPGDRIAPGAVQLRQVYPIALSDDNDALYNAVAGLIEGPTDPNVEVAAFTIPSGTSSAAAAAAVGTKWTVGTTETLSISNDVGLTIDLNPSMTTPAVGDLVRVRSYQASLTPSPWVEQGLRIVTAVSGDTITIDGAGFGGDSTYIYTVPNAGAGARVSAASLLTDDASAAATVVEVDKLWARVQLPGSPTINEPGEPSGRLGMLPLYLPGDKLLFEHGSTPTTREAAVVASVNYATSEVTLTAGLTNAFPTGSKMTRPVPLGTLQAVANNKFSQQTWTRAWSDTLIGTSIAAAYSGAIPMVNEGGATDRWAVVFTSATAFNLFSERLGQIASGTTAADFLPLNPLTNEPYFTLLSTGWGSGWLPGNTLRFNTRAASSPMWLSRLVLPSSPSGTDQAELFMRGDVDA
ncbi:MAG TPA: hypothetical protein PLN55_09965 [Burkholderiaceae bacterium]|nr:hypothetical protein [Burkholderiaceae bacterium]